MLAIYLGGGGDETIHGVRFVPHHLNCPSFRDFVIWGDLRVYRCGGTKYGGGFARGKIKMEILWYTIFESP
jgi:hypothetical protein